MPVRQKTFGVGLEQFDGPFVSFAPAAPLQPNEFAAVGFPPATLFALMIVE